MKLDAMAQVREHARKEGGDELVKKIDEATEREKLAERQIMVMLDEALAVTDEAERLLAVTAINEAVSTALGRAAMEFGRLSKQADAQVLVTAMRSLVNSIQVSFSDRDAEKSGMSDLITKGWKAPEEEK